VAVFGILCVARPAFVAASPFDQPGGTHTLSDGDLSPLLADWPGPDAIGIPEPATLCLPATDAVLGDLDGDHDVDDDDLSVLLAYWGRPSFIGDFNGDGIIEDGDLSVLLANWSARRGHSPVPEPATLSILAVGVSVLIHRRR